MIQLFNVVLFQPLLNLLVFLYNIVPYHDLGVAIILLTIIIKAVLYPLASQSIKSQKALQELQPKMEALKKQYKNDKEKLAKESSLHLSFTPSVWDDSKVTDESLVEIFFHLKEWRGGCITTFKTIRDYVVLSSPQK